MRTKLFLGLVFAGGIFYGGYTLGLSNYNWESVVAKQVAGTAVPQNIEQADFAPMWKAWAILDQKIAPSKASSTKVVTEQDKVWGAIQGLASSFGDPYTTFFPPQESKAFAESVKGSFGGVGMEVTMKDKIITVLLYLNESWGGEGGRLRLLRNSDNLDDYAVEIPPDAGTMLAFRCTPESWHGHKPFEGDRRVIQLNWVTSNYYVWREQARHKLSAWSKRFLSAA